MSSTAATKLYCVGEGLSPGQFFWYKLRAVHPCGCSEDPGPACGAASSNQVLEAACRIGHSRTPVPTGNASRCGVEGVG